MKKFIIPLLTIATVAVLIVTGCRPKEPQRPSYPEEMSCGMVVDLSGPHADMGKKLAAGAEVAVKHVNYWGGIRNMISTKLKLVVADDGGSPERAATEAERLITEEDVLFILGVWPTAMAVSDVAEEHAIPFICPLSLEPELTERGYQYTFRTVGNPSLVAERIVSAMLQFAQDAGVDPPKTCFMEYISDAPSVAVAEEFKSQAEAAGIEIIGEEVVDAMAPTFLPQLQRIEAAKPDTLFSFHYTEDAIILYREMMDRQTYFPYGIFSCGGVEDASFYKSLPPEAYEYNFCYETGDPLPERRRYYTYISWEVYAGTGMEWEDYYVGTTYGAIWIAKEGLERMTTFGITSLREKGAWERELTLDLAKLRVNLKDALAEISITRAWCEKPQLPDATPFLPALHVMRFDKVEFDENGQNIYGGGIVSQNIDGMRWPLYPAINKEPGSPSVVLPIPPWGER